MAHFYPKFTPDDWQRANLLVSTTADRQRKTSHDVRQLAHTLRNETENKTRWTQHDTDSELTLRVEDIDEWNQTLNQTLKNLEVEISKLTEHKNRAERALDLKNVPLEVVLNCLSLREHRIAIDVVKDEVEEELLKELDVIEKIQNLLQLKIQDAFNQLCALQDCHKKVHDDLTDKHTAKNIDTGCVDLSNSAKTISMQLDPTRIKNGIVTPEKWMAFSADNTAKAEAQIQSSVLLRERINETIYLIVTDLEAQWMATNYAFRKRIHEVEQARNELEWQKKNTEEEIADMKKAVEDLEIALANKLPPMMVVHTRLENRTYRPNFELCRDKPQYDMVEEVAKIAESTQLLKSDLETSQLTLGTLERTLERVMQDLAIKNNSLDLDNQCMEVRKKLSEHPKDVKAQP